MVVVNGTSAVVQPASASAPAPMALSQETMEVSPSAPQASQMMHGDVASPCLADVVTPRLMTCNGVWLDRAGHILSISWDSDQVVSRDISTSRITVDDDDS
ncbi:hypothetical protein PVAP13_4KG148105 [Panicum virgatum]|uniref:Uncharacterized protein n=1 Tax=Panicum virgatum TaxID=38727 RepID=A0A8T0TIQ8_PANVG|nr:hypothetical protein PVAP13_4KG148105 [Panicum virgatum]